MERLLSEIETIEKEITRLKEERDKATTRCKIEPIMKQIKKLNSDLYDARLRQQTNK